MTTIDEIGRRAATAARADAAELAAARMETGLERLRFDDGPTVVSPCHRVGARRWVAIGVAAVLAAAAAIALIVNVNNGESHRLVPGTNPPTETLAPSTAAATTSSPATTEPRGTTPPITPVTAGSIAVRHDALPPAYPATAFLGMTDQTDIPLVAIGDSRIVSVDVNTPTATVIDPFAPSVSPQPVLLDVQPAGQIAAGPGDVLYGVVQGDGTEMSLDAIALSGDRAGQVVASAPIAAVEFAEAPRGVLGHSADGIIDRRTGETLLGYVDSTGAPTALGRPAHTVAPIAGDLSSGELTVRDPDGKHDWQLTIDRDPTSPGTGGGGAPPAPSSHGGAVVWTTVGPPDDPTSDSPTPTEPVVAVLAADGSGSWYSLTDGWQVAASDLDGSILVRLTGSTVELARLDPPQRFDFLRQPMRPNQRVAFAETLPTTLTAADPCTYGDLDVVPSADGAMGTVYGSLHVRNKGATPCQVSGVPDVAFLDGSNVVSSTDPAVLSQPGEPIVLEPDSWAVSLLGPIASNVCGGSESSQFMLSIGGGVVIVPFSVGGPLQPNGCDPPNGPAGPGRLLVAPFAAIEADGLPHLPENLQITLEAGSTVRAGEVMKFDVVMTASGDSVIISDFNCPIYEEKLGAAVAWYLLECNGSDGILIAPNESVVFHIELPVPSDAPLGPATLTWASIEPSGAAVTATVAIVT
ncbi:MAG: DUF4232 domain-containing protein [Ilumatobacteraceae bacterium]